AGLLTLHRAMDAAGGQRILAGDLDAFVRQHPEFANLKGALEAFYKSSNAAFFAEKPAEAGRLLGWDALLQLTAALAREERGAA
ncbi:MAG: nonribosomal peptide synthetase MxaA, partial [Hyphomicrobium sp.]